jgi:hypothetical protein
MMMFINGLIDFQFNHANDALASFQKQKGWTQSPKESSEKEFSTRRTGNEKSSQYKTGAITIGIIVLLGGLGWGILEWTNSSRSNSLSSLLDFQSTEKEPHPLYRIEVNEKYGFINAAGEIIIEPRFNDATSFSEGLARVRAEFIKVEGGTINEYSFIDTTGDLLLTLPDASYVGEEFSEGVVSILIDDKYGFMNQDGEIVVTPQFDNVMPFSEGLAAVNIGGRCGYIDSDGQFIINPQFAVCFDFSDGLALVIDQEREKILFVDQAGDIKFHSDESVVEAFGFSEGFALIKNDQGAGFIDYNGSYAITPKFESAFPFSEGFAGVKIGGKWGFINEFGDLVIEPQFDWVGTFSEGLAGVEIGGKWGFINAEGKIVINPQFDGVWSYSETLRSSFYQELAKVEIDNKWGYINKEGEIVWWPED